VDVGGTNLGDAIHRAAYDVFGLKSREQAANKAEQSDVGKTVLQDPTPQDESNPNVLVVLTDGESHEGFAADMAAEAHRLGIGIYIIGLGTETGAPIPIEENGQTTTLKFKGQEVITRFEERSLRKVIEGLPSRCGFLAAGSSNIDLYDIYQRVILQQGTQKKEVRFTLWQEKFQIFVGLGLTLVVFSTLLSEQRPVRREK
jgi:Ca-activated chloride channel family protein